MLRCAHNETLFPGPTHNGLLGCVILGLACGDQDGALGCVVRNRYKHLQHASAHDSRSLTHKFCNTNSNSGMHVSGSCQCIYNIVGWRHLLHAVHLGRGQSGSGSYHCVEGKQLGAKQAAHADVCLHACASQLLHHRYNLEGNLDPLTGTVPGHTPETHQRTGTMQEVLSQDCQGKPTALQRQAAPVPPHS